MSIISIVGRIGSGKDTIGKIIQVLTRKENNQYRDTSHWKVNEIISQMPNSDWDSVFTYEIKKFADKLKDVVCLMTGCTRAQLEDQEFKKGYLSKEWWYFTNGTVKIPYNKENHEIYGTESICKPTVRWLLQTLGTDALRNVVHPDIHCIMLFADYKPIGSLDYRGRPTTDETKICYPEYPNWIITDLRYPNELRAIKDKDSKAIIIRVVRELPCQVCKLTKYKRRGDHCMEIACPSGREQHDSETSLDEEKVDYVIENNSDIPSLINQVRDILIQEGIISM